MNTISNTTYTKMIIETIYEKICDFVVLGSMNIEVESTEIDFGRVSTISVIAGAVIFMIAFL